MRKKKRVSKEEYRCISIMVFGILLAIVIASPYLLKFFICLGVFPEYLSQGLQKDNFVDEVQIFISFMASIATIAIAIGAYTQLRSLKESSENTGKTLRMDFGHHLDKQWCSKENTAVRQELWTEYRKAIKRKDDCWSGVCEKACERKVGIRAVQNYVVQVDEKGESEPSNNKALFEHLNFLELMGSIYLFKEEGVLDDELLQNLFAGRLHMYLKFYETYLKKHYGDKATNQKPYALKLLEYLDELEAKNRDKNSITD